MENHFGNGAVPVAHTAEIPSPGSFVTVDVEGAPLLVVRQDDDSVMVLSNVCRHRGAQVETRPTGRRKVFSCPYHRWCYNRDGGIRSMPFDDGFVGVDRVDRSLLPVPSAVRFGMVWTTAEHSLELHVDELGGAELEALGAARLLHIVRHRIERPLAAVLAELPTGADVAGLRVTDAGTHLEVRSARPTGKRLDASLLDVWILLASDADTAAHEAAEASWERISA